VSTFIYRAEEPRDNRPSNYKDNKKAKVNALAFLPVIDIASFIKVENFRHNRIRPIMRGKRAALRRVLLLKLVIKNN
jgi:hypothetical protein